LAALCHTTGDQQSHLCCSVYLHPQLTHTHLHLAHTLPHLPTTQYPKHHPLNTVCFPAWHSVILSILRSLTIHGGFNLPISTLEGPHSPTLTSFQNVGSMLKHNFEKVENMIFVLENWRTCDSDLSH
jgi:hypothetical protein